MLFDRLWKFRERSNSSDKVPLTQGVGTSPDQNPFFFTLSHAVHTESTISVFRVRQLLIGSCV